MKIKGSLILDSETISIQINKDRILLPEYMIPKDARHGDIIELSIEVEPEDYSEDDFGGYIKNPPKRKFI